MRHRVVKHNFGRRHGPKKALLRGLVDSLVEHGRIKTTLPKAKELRRHVEKAVTIGKKQSVHARRLLLSRYPNQNTVKTLVDDLGKRFLERPGGYTRIIKLGSRPGDQAEMALIEFVDYKVPENYTEQIEEQETLKAEINEKRVIAAKKKLRKSQRQARRVSR